MMSVFTSRIWILAAIPVFASLYFAVPAHAQGAARLPDNERSIGVPRYVPPAPARFRIVFGYGGNAGLGLLTPSTILGGASYQTGMSVLTAGFVSSRSVTSDVPYRIYSEFDLMYGIAFESALPHYEDPSDNLHGSLSTGISFDSYSERWRPYGRRALPYYDYPPTTFQFSLGLPIQLQAIYEPLRILGIGFGIGAELFCNISNFKPSYGGALVVEARY